VNLLHTTRLAVLTPTVFSDTSLNTPSVSVGLLLLKFEQFGRVVLYTGRVCGEL
jgi:hypothetical protein